MQFLSIHLQNIYPSHFFLPIFPNLFFLFFSFPFSFPYFPSLFFPFLFSFPSFPSFFFFSLFSFSLFPFFFLLPYFLPCFSFPGAIYFAPPSHSPGHSSPPSFSLSRLAS